MQRLGQQAEEHPRGAHEERQRYGRQPDLAGHPPVRGGRSGATRASKAASQSIVSSSRSTGASPTPVRCVVRHTTCLRLTAQATVAHPARGQGTKGGTHDERRRRAGGPGGRRDGVEPRPGDGAVERATRTWSARVATTARCGRGWSAGSPGACPRAAPRITELQPTSANGMSNETLLLTACWREGGEPRQERLAARLAPDPGDVPVFPGTTWSASTRSSGWSAS